MPLSLGNVSKVANPPTQAILIYVSHLWSPWAATRVPSSASEFPTRLLLGRSDDERCSIIVEAMRHERLLLFMDVGAPCRDAR